MSPNDHPPEMVNIVLGKIAQETVNVDRAVKLGSNQMKELNKVGQKAFMRRLDSQKYIKVGDTKVYDTELTFSRVIGLQASSCEVGLKALLS